MKQFTNFFSKLWPQLKPLILEQLKGAIVKKFIKTMLKTAGGSGFMVWFATWIAENFYEEAAKPIAEAAFVRVGFEVRHINGTIMAKKIKKAREDKDEEAYDAAVDDIFE